MKNPNPIQRGIWVLWLAGAPVIANKGGQIGIWPTLDTLISGAQKRQNRQYIWEIPKEKMN